MQLASGQTIDRTSITTFCPVNIAFRALANLSSQHGPVVDAHLRLAPQVQASVKLKYPRGNLQASPVFDTYTLTLGSKVVIKKGLLASYLTFMKPGRTTPGRMNRWGLWLQTSTRAVLSMEGGPLHARAGTSAGGFLLASEKKQKAGAQQNDQPKWMTFNHLVA